MFKTRKILKNDNGFTLVELMVTVALTAIAVLSIYRGYTAFSHSADVQQQIMEMQQNLRIGMTRLSTDIRRAGINEEDDDSAGFIAADAASIEFSMDLGSANGPVVFGANGKDDDEDDVTNPDEEDESRIGDGDVNDDGEQIHFYLDDEDVNDNGVLEPVEDLNKNGLIDQWLMREVWVGDPSHGGAPGGYGPPQKVIDNVEALDFVYFDDTGATTSDLDKIDRVEVTLVVRATNEDYRYTNRETYTNLQGAPLVTNPGDNFRRRAFSMSVQIRNNI